MAIQNVIKHTHNGVDSTKISSQDIFYEKLAKVTAPTGGLTVEQESRDAINAIITRLEQLNFIVEN